MIQGFWGVPLNSVCFNTWFYSCKQNLQRYIGLGEQKIIVLAYWRSVLATHSVKICIGIWQEISTFHEVKLVVDYIFQQRDWKCSQVFLGKVRHSSWNCEVFGSTEQRAFWKQTIFNSKLPGWRHHFPAFLVKIFSLWHISFISSDSLNVRMLLWGKGRVIFPRIMAKDVLLTNHSLLALFPASRPASAQEDSQPSSQSQPTKMWVRSCHCPIHSLQWPPTSLRVKAWVLPARPECSVPSA